MNADKKTYTKPKAEVDLAETVIKAGGLNKKVRRQKRIAANQQLSWFVSSLLGEIQR